MYKNIVFFHLICLRRQQKNICFQFYQVSIFVTRVKDVLVHDKGLEWWYCATAAGCSPTLCSLALLSSLATNRSRFRIRRADSALLSPNSRVAQMSIDMCLNRFKSKGWSCYNNSSNRLQ